MIAGSRPKINFILSFGGVAQPDRARGSPRSLRLQGLRRRYKKDTAA